MLAGTLSQVSELVFALAVGVAVGLLYELFAALRRLFHGNMIVTVVADILFCAAAFLLYASANYLALDLRIKWYVLLGNAAGFLLERNSLGRLLAKFFEIVYNFILKQKSKRKGSAHDGEEN